MSNHYPEHLFFTWTVLRIEIWHLFGDLSQSDNISEIKPPLPSNQEFSFRLFSRKNSLALKIFSVQILSKGLAEKVPTSAIFLRTVNIYYLTVAKQIKVSFFQKVQFVFQISKSPKTIFQITILNLIFEIPAHNSKQLIQISSSGQ